MMAPRAAIYRCRGVTLLEMLLAMSLLVLLSSMTYWFYFSALESQERDTLAARKLQLARVVLQRIANEIRQASLITADNRVGIRGAPERIWLSTLRVPSRDLSRERSTNEGPPPAEYDLVKIEYKIARHPEILHEDGYEAALGLARVEHRIPRPDSAETGAAFEDEERVFSRGEDGELIGEELLLGDDEDGPGFGGEADINWEELYATEVKFLRFCYFDGYTWWDRWEIVGENPLPQLVKLTIGFEMHPPFDAELGVRDPEAEEFCTCLNRDPIDCEPLPDDQFTRTIRVAQADPFFRSRVTRETQALLQQLGEGMP